MPNPGTTGTDTRNQQMAARIAILESVTATALANATGSTSGNVTINAGQGVITSPNLTTSLSYTLTVTNSVVSSGDIVWIGVQAGTNTASVALSPGILTVGNGVFSAVFNNTNTTAHNGTLNFTFSIQKMVGFNVVD